MHKRYRWQSDEKFRFPESPSEAKVAVEQLHKEDLDVSFKDIGDLM